MIHPSTEFSIGQVAAHYDDLDRFYREVWGEHLHHGLWDRGGVSPVEAVARLVTFVADKAGMAVGNRVCDVGCGYGATARQLVREQRVEVVGFTVSPAQYEYAIRHSAGNPAVQVILRDWQDNQLPPELMDNVVSLECLAHVPNKHKLFDEIRRVLKPGCKAVITAWLAAEQPAGWQVRHLLEPICREGRLAGLGSPTEYRLMISDLNLELVEFQRLGNRVRRTWSICGRRAFAGLLTKPEYRFLLHRPSENWVFFLTLWRMILAYRLGAVDFGLFVIRKPLGDRIEVSWPERSAERMNRRS